MSNKEKYKKAFSVLNSSCDFTLEEKRMNRIKRENTHRNLLVAAAVMFVVLAGSGTAYAADIGGIRETVQMWIHGEQTDVTINDESIEYVDGDGNKQVETGVSVDPENGERPLTGEEIAEEKVNEVDVDKTDDGKMILYFHDKQFDITDNIANNNCKFHVVADDGEIYVELDIDSNGDFSITTYPRAELFTNYVELK
ncbi:hypothetical protein [Butyrivibrio sp. M55]|uniref:hypothetical protein n=1 Tax=Butyrivibrio sp. M55 TaxID=1855323 RepID=UPI0008F24667|nr:hypothetical protein [Butyrivibrio sp. M55]SFU75462.1 hypothetical protein SAMN05216540_10893 [Butyrivibrio sp. M55]